MRVSNVDKRSKVDERPVRLCNYVDVYKNERVHAGVRFMRATASEQEIDRFRLALGDVLITKDSEDWQDIGVPALVEYVADDLLCGYHVAILRPYTAMVGDYLLRALQSRPIKWQFRVAAAGVTRYGLTHNAIRSVRVSLPPLAEQTAIARFLDHADRRIRALHPHQGKADRAAGGAEAGHHPPGRDGPDRCWKRPAVSGLQGLRAWSGWGRCRSIGRIREPSEACDMNSVLARCWIQHADHRSELPDDTYLETNDTCYKLYGHDINVSGDLSPGISMDIHPRRRSRSSVAIRFWPWTIILVLTRKGSLGEVGRLVPSWQWRRADYRLRFPSEGRLASGYDRGMPIAISRVLLLYLASYRTMADRESLQAWCCFGHES